MPEAKPKAGGTAALSAPSKARSKQGKRTKVDFAEARLRVQARVAVWREDHRQARKQRNAAVSDKVVELKAAQELRTAQAQAASAKAEAAKVEAAKVAAEKTATAKAARAAAKAAPKAATPKGEEKDNA